MLQFQSEKENLMKLKQSVMVFLTLNALLMSSALMAAEFDWMVGINVRSHSDPSAYRYGLIDRFSYGEPEIIYILDSVREPADAYMILRLAELSHRPPEYVLRLYRERRFTRWDDYASFLGIRELPTYHELYRHHDIVYRHRPPVRYEEHHNRNMPPQRVQQETHGAVPSRHVTPQNRPVTIRQQDRSSHPDVRHVAPDTKRHDPKTDNRHDSHGEPDRDRH